MTWMHCLNCGWQGENNAGKSEKVTGGLMLAAGIAAAILAKPIWFGVILAIVGVVTLLMSVGAAATMVCPHCQSSDIKKYKPSIDSHQGGASPPSNK